MKPAKGFKILIVDDQPESLDLLEEILSEEPYEIYRASDGEEALKQVEQCHPDCLILDVMMPRLDGFSVCKILKGSRKTYLIPIILLTALTDTTSKITGLEAGADDFLNKPVNPLELLTRVRSLVRIKSLRDELNTAESIIISLVRALEILDPQGAGHAERVALGSIRLGKTLGLSSHTLETMAKAAILHDIGKIGIPDRLRKWESALEGEDLKRFQQHPLLGEQILKPLKSFKEVRAIVRHHHECLDGSGYPDGIGERELNLTTEIVALVNLYDNLLREGKDSQEVSHILLQKAEEGKYHPWLVQAFLKMPDLPQKTYVARLDTWEEILPIPEDVTTGKILVVDDTLANREILEEILVEEGHQVISLPSGEEALQKLGAIKPDLILLDVRMPTMNGFEVCRHIKSHLETAFLPVILITAKQALEDRRISVAVGADDYLTLPINRMELIARVRSLLRLRLYYRDLEENQSVLISLTSTLEAKDPYLRGHSERVGELSVGIARVMGLGEAFQNLLRLGGHLHDVGKIGMPEKVLHKPGKLTQEEFQTIMVHPVRGEEICSPLSTIKSVLPIIRHHHERYDGSGYPDHLKGEAIPLGARILGLADAFDALTSQRPYRKKITWEEALKILEEETAQGRWDPKVFNALKSYLYQIYSA